MYSQKINKTCRIIILLLSFSKMSYGQLPVNKASENGFFTALNKEQDIVHAISYNLKGSRMGFLWGQQKSSKKQYQINQDNILTPLNTKIISVNTGFSLTEDESIFSFSKGGFSPGFDISLKGASKCWKETKGLEDQDLHSTSVVVEIFDEASVFNNAKLVISDKDTALKLSKGVVTSDNGVRAGINFEKNHTELGNKRIVALSVVGGHVINDHTGFDTYSHVAKTVIYKDKNGQSQTIINQNSYLYGTPENKFYFGWRVDFIWRMITLNDENKKKCYGSAYTSLMGSVRTLYYQSNRPIYDFWLGPVFGKNNNRLITGLLFKVTNALALNDNKSFLDICSFNIFFGIPFGNSKL